ncbi:hypothetical protein O6H91_04G097500 [Diphasiastrum complanatum]|uniref:Uncharacterized protein n=1 Tax=Diphasiastrum complanatum TaxID=34168 RepID=A0ACC2DZU9_DIPCM|nr:hypothetical protein O6H91_04G097500 [Diphasiastrum complanatum]
MDDRYLDIPSGATYQYAGKDIPSEDSSGLPWTIKQNVSPNNADSQRFDAGAVFVLESKASIASPTLLSLPFAFAGLGWGPGILALIAGGILSFYCYCLLSKVLEKCESQGHRYIRFRDLSRAVLGPKWSSLVIAPLQMLLCMGVVIRCILLAGECLKIIYQLYKPDGSLRLYYFIIVMGVVMLVISQVPSFHALRYINLLSLVTCFGYTLCVVGGAIYAGHSKLAPVRDYSLAIGLWTKTFNVFSSLSIIATAYGSGINPEIQATIAPPTAGKMFKGLLSSYMVAIVCYFLIAISSYWAFGNRADGNIFNNFIGSQGSTLILKWLLLLGIILAVMQLVALGSVCVHSC